MNERSSNPRSDGRRVARAQLHTHRQNGSSAWPLNRHFIEDPYIDREVPVYALASGLLSGHASATVGGMAARHVETIRGVFPRGTYQASSGRILFSEVLSVKVEQP